jgi:hypothetical protein
MKVNKNNSKGGSHQTSINNESIHLNRSSSSYYLGNKPLVPGAISYINNKKTSEKRTSINSYNKRVVELNLNQYTVTKSTVFGK